MAIGTAMLLAASRSGASTELYRELGESLPQLLSRFETGIPDMYPKAYRWVPEMREIAAFLSEDKAAAMIFEGAAQLYDRLATDIANEGQERGTLDEFFQKRCGL
jgi:putative dehydrogenase